MYRRNCLPGLSRPGPCRGPAALRGVPVPISVALTVLTVLQISHSGVKEEMVQATGDGAVGPVPETDAAPNEAHDLHGAAGGRVAEGHPSAMAPGAVTPRDV